VRGQQVPENPFAPLLQFLSHINLAPDGSPTTQLKKKVEALQKAPKSQVFFLKFPVLVDVLDGSPEWRVGMVPPPTKAKFRTPRSSSSVAVRVKCL